MIAKNYLKFPEALQYQCEMFSKSYKNSPRTMRLMECIFSFKPDVPQWVKDKARRMRELVKLLKSQMVEMFSLNGRASLPIRDWAASMQMDIAL